MNKIAGFSNKERNELFFEAASKMGVAPVIIEKDFWVTWVLGKIFKDPILSNIFIFKGGTSLSKVFHIIERFSEDIDLILDWSLVTKESPLIERSKTKQDKFNKEINQNAQIYIANNIMPIVSSIIKPYCKAEIDKTDPHIIQILYPKAFSSEYIRSIIQLEIGPLASWTPFRDYKINSYAADMFPDLFNEKHCKVKAINAERTFWEKATILHQEAHRPEGKIQPARYSRHYYDLARLAESPIRNIALKQIEMLKTVANFKQKFYPCNWAYYHTALPKTLKLIPEDRVLYSLEKDYKKMHPMFFGKYPKFEYIIKTIQSLENEINNM